MASTGPLALPAPPATYGPVLTYDATDGYTIAVVPNWTAIGTPSSTVETWEFSNGSWSQLHPPVSPSNRGGASLTYDPVDGQVLLFGGLRLTCSTCTWPLVTNETWAFSHGNWTNLTRSVTGSPSARFLSPFVWDSTDHFGLLFGGSDLTNLTDTWSFASGRWSLVASATAGPPVSGGALSDDPAANGVVYFGGQNRGTALPSPSTWTFSGGTWTNSTATLSGSPGGLWNPAMTYDPAVGGVLLFGGALRTNGWQDQGTTWALVNSVWSTVATSAGPSPRMAASLAFDPSLSAAVMFGGFNETVPLGDTWVLNTSSGWMQADPILRISQVASDVGLPLSFSVASHFAVGPVSYSYAGLPPGCPGVNAPALDCSPTAPGNFTVEVAVSDSGVVSPAVVHLAIAAVPAITSITASRELLDVGQNTTLTLLSSGGTAPLAYSYSALPPGCTSVNAPELVCAPSGAGVYAARASVADALGVSASGSLGLTVNPRLQLVALSWTPAEVHAGETATLTATVQGGTAGFAFAYTGLPPGCASLNASSLSCSPGAAGNYTISVTVVDAVSAIATGTSTLSVLAALPQGTVPPSGSGIPPVWETFLVGAVPGLLVLIVGAVWLVRKDRMERAGRALRARLEGLAAERLDAPRLGPATEDRPRTENRRTP